MLKSMIETICRQASWSFHDERAQVPIGERTQDVYVETFEEGGEEFARLVSRIGPASALNDQRLTAALRLNANMRFGALAIVGDDLSVVDTFLIREADLDEVRESMAYIAKTADRYENALFSADEN